MSTGRQTLAEERLPAPQVDVTETGAPRMVADELGRVISTVCAKFPSRPRAEVEAVVAAAYRHLHAGATVTSHLIPLTLNRSLRVMRASVGRTSSRELDLESGEDLFPPRRASQFRLSNHT
jgi:hypothetical protein